MSYTIGAILELRDKGFTSTVKESTSATGKLKNELDKSSSSNKKFGESLKSAGAIAGKVALGLGAMGVAGVGSAVMMANKFADTTDRIDKMSQSLGFSKSGFQEWDYILTQNGTSIDSLGAGIKTLRTRMDESITGTGKGSDAFKQLNISATDSTGALKTQEQMFEETVRALQGMEDGTKKAMLAQELFGKSGADLLPLLNGTADSVEELKNKANEYGMIVGDNAIAAGVLWADTMDTGKRAIGGLFNTVAGKALPTLQKFLQMGVDNMPKLQQKISSAMSIAGNVLTWVGDKGMIAFNAVRDAIKGNQPTIEKLREVASDFGGVIINAFEKAQPYIEWFVTEGIPKGVDAVSGLVEQAIKLYSYIKDNWSNIEPFVIGIATAFITWKAVTMAHAGVTAILTAKQIALNFAMNANPLGLIVLGIGLVIGAGILLYKNWDTVKEKAIELWSTTKEKFTSIKDSVMTSLQPVMDFFTNLKQKWDSFKESISNFKMPKIGLPKWMGGNGLIQTDGSHETGLSRVPYDGYIAELHKDEAVLPKSEAERYRQGNVTNNNTNSTVTKQNGISKTINIEEVNVYANTSDDPNDFAEKFVTEIKLRLENI